MVGELALMAPIAHRHFEALSTLVTTSIAQTCVEDHHDEPQKLARWLSLYSPDNVRSLLREPRSCALASISGPTFTAVSQVSGSGQLQLCHVAPQWQGQGIGRHLLQAQEEQARRRQICSMYIDATTGARRFFERLGYEPTGMAYTSQFGDTLSRLRKSLKSCATCTATNCNELDLSPYQLEHAELSSIIHRIRMGALQLDLTDPTSAALALDALSRLSQRLTLHLIEEKHSVYPKLKLRDGALRARAEKLEREHGGLLQAFKAYEAKWATPAIVAADARAFIAQTRSLFDSIERRIYREDLELYRAAEPVE